MREVVDLSRVDARDVRLGGLRERRVGEELRPRARAHSGDEPVAPERLLVEEHAGAERRVALAIVIAIEPLRHDAEFREEALGDGTVLRRRLDRLRPGVAEQQPIADAKLVAPGVPAEVVVVVEDEDARARELLAVKVRRGQPADAAAYDDQVVVLAGCLRRRRLGPKRAVPQAMRDRIRRVVLAAQARQRGRIRAGGSLAPDGHPPAPAASAVNATPSRKSRRAMRRFMPRSRSLRSAIVRGSYRSGGAVPHPRRPPPRRTPTGKIGPSLPPCLHAAGMRQCPSPGVARRRRSANGTTAVILGESSSTLEPQARGASYPRAHSTEDAGLRNPRGCGPFGCHGVGVAPTAPGREDGKTSSKCSAIWRMPAA